MSAHPLDALSGFLDGELDVAARAGVEAHLAACDDCRALVADLTALRASAAGLALTEVAPDADLWPGIAARLAGPREIAPSATGASSHPSGETARPAWYQRRWSVGLPELAMAATLAAAIGTALLWPRAVPDVAPADGPVPIIAEVESFESNDAQVAPVNFADAQYDAAVGDLEQVLLQQRERLDPRTVIVLERNLRVIDDAIREARQALATDPANTLLNAHLAGARQRKLDLLRRAAQITEGD